VGISLTPHEASKHATGAACQGQQQTLCKRLAQQTRALGTQRSPNRKLSLSLGTRTSSRLARWRQAIKRTNATAPAKQPTELTSPGQSSGHRAAPPSLPCRHSYPDYWAASLIGSRSFPPDPRNLGARVLGETQVIAGPTTGM